MKGLAPFLALALTPVAAASFTLEPVEGWRSFFGGDEQVFHFQVSPKRPMKGRIGWSLRFGGRTIVRGEKGFVSREKEGSPVSVPFTLPEPREGVDMPLIFEVKLHDVDGDKLLARWEDTLRLYSRDPFALEKEWAQPHAIGLYDPDKKISAALEALRLPYERLRSFGGFENFNGALLIVGGVDFAAHRGLWEEAVAAARRGTPVLVLAPLSGTVPIGDGEGKSLLGSATLTLRHEEVIHRFDKKLDAESWPPDGRVSASTFILKGGRDGVKGEFSPASSGWPWLEADFPRDGAKLIVCGFDVIGKINESPTPRLLFFMILKYMTEGGKREERSSVP